MSLLERYLKNKYRIDAPYFLRGGFWLSISQVVTIIGGISVSALFAYLLSENDYGTYRYLIGIGVLISSFSLTGLSQSVLQTAAKKYIQYYRESIRIGLIYSLGITTISLIGFLYYIYNGNITLALGCLIIAIFQPLTNTFQNIFPYLQGNRQFKESTIVQTVKTIIVSGISICTILVTQDILILLISYFIAHTLTNFLAHLYYLPRETSPLVREISKKYTDYAKHTSLRNIIANIAFRLDTIIVFQQLGATELAIYTIANIVPEQIKGSFKNLASLLIPKFAEHDNLENLKKSLPERSLQLFLIFILITLVYILLVPFVYSILFPKYEDAIFLSQLAALSFPAAIALLPFSMLQSQLKDKELYILGVQNAVITIILTVILILTNGLIGAIIAKILSRYINLIFSYYSLLKVQS